MSTILNGKELSYQIKDELRELAEKANVRPRLAIVSVGDDPSSAIYMRNKISDCDECGFDSTFYNFSSDTTTEDLLEVICRLNVNNTIHGIIVQLPLPKTIDEWLVTSVIDTKKDVDCLNPLNMGYLMKGRPQFVPCTPGGIMMLLDHYNIDVAGKLCTIIGRSNIVGKPMGQLLLQRDATVIQCHSKSPNLWTLVNRADIVISATGVRSLIEPMALNGHTIAIDVGITRDENGKLHGDFAPECEPYCDYFTPVPGGVGPMTRAMLMKNLLMACEPDCFK